MSISHDVVIMTRAEFRAAEDHAFARGVERWKFEAGYSSRPIDGTQQAVNPAGVAAYAGAVASAAAPSCKTEIGHADTD